MQRFRKWSEINSDRISARQERKQCGMFKRWSKSTVYVIDKEKRLVYFDDGLEELVPGVKQGDYCYKAICHEEYPCKNCPAAEDGTNHSVYYNSYLNKWMDVSAYPFRWSVDDGEYTWLVIYDTNEFEGSTFAKMTQSYEYDELLEMNLTRNTYKVLCHDEERTLFPAKEGILGEFLEYGKNCVMHPADKERFAAFWDLEHIASCLNGGKEETVMNERFREKRSDGSYQWTEQVLVPVRVAGNSDLIAMCFLKDVKGAVPGQEKSDGIAVDVLTGLPGRPAFLKNAEKFLKENPDRKWCLVSIDIEHFKLFNEWFGVEAGDRILSNIGSCLKEFAKDGQAAAGYFGGDDFYVLLPDTEEKIRQVEAAVCAVIMDNGEGAGFLPAIGVYKIGEEKLSLGDMCDKAQIAATAVKGNYRERISIYNSGMGTAMDRRKKLLSDVQYGIDNHEFVAFFQPKCNLETGKIVGLEALSRWKHHSMGMVSPGEYIPLLESTGLITNLDMYMWEEVCRAMHSWEEQGHKLLPVSVNVSIVDLHVVDVPQVFRNLADKYKIQLSNLEVEITESAYAEDFELIKRVVVQLREMGITVLMDDFGSGYSSLNMLKDIDVDILKMDMKFVQVSGQNSARGINITESVVRLANIMNLRLIAEGVETREQIEFLKKMGCIYAQGYYFYRPMSREALDELLKEEGIIDFRGIRERRIGHLYAQDLFTGDEVSDTIINNMLGAVIFYEYYQGKITILRANDQYFSLMGMNVVDVEDRREFIMDSIYPDDRELFRSCAEKSYVEKVNGARVILRIRKGEQYGWFVLNNFFLNEKDGHQTFYASLQDVTDIREMHHENCKTSSQNKKTSCNQKIVQKRKCGLQGM